MFVERHYRLILATIWLIQLALLLIVAWQTIFQWEMVDPDDQLRLAQVRDWIAGQSWWDIHQYRMNPPSGGDMHWSRLVDVPIAAMIVLLTPLLTQPLAEQVTVVVIPLLTMGVVVYLIAAVARGLFGTKAALIAAASVIFMFPVIIQLVPMRIDHHGWQMVMFLLGVKYTLDPKAPAKAAIITGIVMSLWMEISIEGLPFAIFFMGLLALRWVNRDEQRWSQLAWAMASLAVTNSVMFSSTEKLQLAGNHCDELSPFHLVAFAVSATIIVVGTLATRSLSHRMLPVVKIAICGIAAAAAIAVVLQTVPECVGDTFAGLDPLVRKFWYNRVYEGLPLWHQPTGTVVQEIAGLLCGLFAIILLFAKKSQLPVQERITIALLYLACSAVGLLVARAAVYALCLAMILLSPIIVTLFANAEKTDGIVKRNAMRILACALFMPGILGENASVVTESFDGPSQSKLLDKKIEATGLPRQCQSKEKIELLDRLPRARLMANLDISPALLLFTRHKVVATGHHRNQLAMREVILSFTAQPEIAREIYAKRGIEYLVTCDGSSELLLYRTAAPTGMWARLHNGGQINWLDRQPDIGPYRVWRVNTEVKTLPANRL